MASPASPPEASEIRRRGRRRLIGAVAIALLLVVFVPMILDSEPRPSRNESALEIPAKENAPPLPAPLPARPQPAPAIDPPAAAATPATKAAPVTAAPATKAAPVNAAPAPTKTELPAKSAPVDTPKLEGFAVQVGAFKDDDKLKQARDKLAAAGIRHYVERRDTPAGELRRLRAGPFPSREAADKALAAVKAAGLDAQVVPLP